MRAAPLKVKRDFTSEWQTGAKDRIVLQDEDVTTKNDGILRRLNTVGYYRLPDGATVSLVPRQRSLYSVNSSTSNNKSSSASKYGNNTYTHVLCRNLNFFKFQIAHIL